MNCIKCKNLIPQIRLEILPDTNTCKDCSTVATYVGFMDWNHKTAPELVMISSSDTENLRRATRMNARSR